MNRFLFDHIPKTGGTALYTVFCKILGDGNVSPMILFDRLSQVQKTYEKFQLIHGHYKSMPGERMPSDRRCATLLRDPIDRCLSTYFFNKFDVPATLGEQSKSINLAKSLTLDEYVNSADPAVLADLDNYQSRHFCTLKCYGDTIPSNDRVLELAKQALEEYDLVGVHESFNDFIDVLCYQWAWPLIETTPRIKQTISRQSIRDVKPEILKKLRTLNELDIELYETAKAMFEKSRRSVIKDAVNRRLSFSDTLKTVDKITTHNGNDSESEKTDKQMHANFGNHKAMLIGAEISGNISLGAQLFSSEIVTIKLKLTASDPIDDLTVGFSIVHENGVLMYGTNSRCLGFALSIDRAGEYLVEYSFQILLGLGGYWLGASLHLGESHLEECYHWIDRLAFFQVVGKIGKHFEGIVCLQPMINICDNQETGGLIATELTNNKSGLNPVTFHHPVLTEPSATIQVMGTPTEISCNEVVIIEMIVTNTGFEHWRTGGQRPLRACYHWLDSNRGMYWYEGLRSALPTDIAPGGSVKVSATIAAPKIAGSFILCLTLVQENGLWFDDYGCSSELLIKVN